MSLTPHDIERLFHEWSGGINLSGCMQPQGQPALFMAVRRVAPAA